MAQVASDIHWEKQEIAAVKIQNWWCEKRDDVYKNVNALPDCGQPNGTRRKSESKVSKVNKVRFFCFFSLFVTLVLQSNFPPCVCVLLRLPRPISAQAFL